MQSAELHHFQGNMERDAFLIHLRGTSHLTALLHLCVVPDSESKCECSFCMIMQTRKLQTTHEDFIQSLFASALDCLEVPLRPRKRQYTQTPQSSLPGPQTAILQSSFHGGAAAGNGLYTICTHKEWSSECGEILGVCRATRKWH